ncbi:hypothetical protein GOODEAATRI_030002 [Goodea atripinnis]|uniref:Maturase K n=1 Tax=Goodea atripinnis TaxID=208336 RepID=A0ABV0P8W4_9TELE
MKAWASPFHQGKLIFHHVVNAHYYYLVRTEQRFCEKVFLFFFKSREKVKVTFFDVKRDSYCHKLYVLSFLLQVFRANSIHPENVGFFLANREILLSSLAMHMGLNQNQYLMTLGQPLGHNILKCISF